MPISSLSIRQGVVLTYLLSLVIDSQKTLLLLHSLTHPPAHPLTHPPAHPPAHPPPFPRTHHPHPPCRRSHSIRVHGAMWNRVSLRRSRTSTASDPSLWAAMQPPLLPLEGERERARARERERERTRESARERERARESARARGERTRERGEREREGEKKYMRVYVCVCVFSLPPTTPPPHTHDTHQPGDPRCRARALARRRLQRCVQARGVAVEVVRPPKGQRFQISVGPCARALSSPLPLLLLPPLPRTLSASLSHAPDIGLRMQ
jgi:hypothetical protein